MNDRLHILINDYLDGSLDPAGWDELKELLASEDHRNTFSRMAGAELDHQTYENADPAILQRILRNITNEGESRPIKTYHRVHFLKTAWLRYAASIILTAGLAVIGYYLITGNHKGQETAAGHKANTTNTTSDILPGSNKAVLTLSDGRRVELDSATSGTIQDQALSIENDKGELVYSNHGIVTMNTMTTPRGGQYQLTLADGSRVWLNAASAITYPTAFAGSERRVKVEGEAYFEVAANAKQPFVVETKSDTVIVLGTAFNVHRYTDEGRAKTTLVTGSIRIRNKILQPGQALENGTIKGANIAQDIAWKNGYFSLDNKSIGQLMQEVARWYDIEVEYQGTVPDKQFVGEIGRNLKLSQVVEGLRNLGLAITIKSNKRVIITP